jgi:valyl-tRNA synthetase
MSDAEMPKLYVPASAEDRWYAWWEKQGFFQASNAPEDTRATYTIAIPPPNVTGTLHMGHACRTTFEDLLTRYERMQGKNALWIPGTDHAGIATQVVVERKLKAEGLTRHDLGREKFIERVWEWRKESGDTILGQLRKMGASCDWSRTKFTMDPDLSHSVREAFVRLYEEGLIYRGTRLVNWDVVSQTVLSDLEVETEENVKYTEEFGVCELFDFAYKLDDADAAATGVAEIIVSTTRPETMLGDTALAVHPEDERYTALHGRFVTHPFVARRIPILCDAELVDPAFGTGVVKVTPAHDPNDFATGKRHGLEEISILNKDGTLNENGGPFQGLDRFAARKAVKAKLEELGLVRGWKKHIMSLPRSQRSGSIVEPMISTQWFVKMEPLAGPAITAVEDGRVRILPEDWTKTYFHWLRNIQDWCISRQLWWGHSIPAWYCGDCEHMSVSRDDLTACAACGSTKIEQDPDVLDTWFSSALWPFSTLGWPNQTPDLARFYPTQDMETGYDILFFWVARMIMMGLHFMGEVPFSRVLLAGLVTDERGQKMSKVKGNVIDPLDVIHGTSGAALIEKAEKSGAAADGVDYLRTTYPDGFDAYGADALRMTLLSYSPQSRRIALSIKRIEGYRNFANKLWNAARYVLGRLQGQDGEEGQPAGAARHPNARARGVRPAVTALPNRWILSRLDVALAAANAGIEAYRLDEGSQALYHFVWDELCDWYLELSKPLLDGDDRALAEETAEVLLHVLETTLRALHPMMPFITEDIWQRVPRADAAAATESIMLARYPEAGRDGLRDEASETELTVVQEFIVAARSIRAEYDLPRRQPIAIHWVSEDKARAATIEAARSLIEALAGATLTQDTAARVDNPHEHFTLAAVFVLPGMRGVVPGVIDPVKERERLSRQLGKIEKDLGVLEKKLTNEKFVSGAPPEVVEQTKRDAAELAEKRDQMSAAITRLG